MKIRSDHLVLLLSLIVVAAIVRLIGINFHPLWLDEAYSHWFATQNLNTLWHEVLTYETHPPMYYTMLHFWISLVGDSQTAMRLLSVIFSVATVPIIFMLGYRIGSPDKRTELAVLAGLLFSLSPLAIHYAREARPYAIMTFFASLFMLSTVLILRIFEPQHYSQRKELGIWALFVLSGAMTIWMHNVSTLTIPVICCILTLTCLIKAKSFIPLWKFALAGLAIFMLWSPYLHWFLLQSQVVTNGFWVPFPTVHFIIQSFLFLVGIPGLESPALGNLPVLGSLPIHVFFEIFLLGIAFLGTYRLVATNRWNIAVVLVSAVFIPFILIVVLSILVQPVLIPRILIWISVPYLVLMASGILSIPNKTGRGIIIASVCFCFFWVQCTNSCIVDCHESWDSVASYVQEHAEAEDAIWFYLNHNEIPFNYYFSGSQKTRGLPAPFPAPGLPNDYTANLAVPILLENDIANLGKELPGIKRLWLIFRGGDGRSALAVALKNLIEERMQLTDEKKFHAISVCLYTLDRELSASR